MKIIPFYSKNEYKEFSNLYRTSFTYRNIKFDSVEMFVMYAKACLLCGQYLMIVRFVLDPSCAYHDYIRNYDNDVIELWIDKLKMIKASL